MANQTALPSGGGLYAGLLARGISRRAFLQFSAAMATALALPASYAPRIARAVETAPRLPLIWLRGQDCGGNTMALLRANEPTMSQLLLELVSVEYHETIMASAGYDAEQTRLDAMAEFADGYVAVIDGSIPTADGGVHCLVAGRPFRDVAREVCDGALATIAVGSCASDGGVPAAGGGPTGAVSAGDAVGGGRLIRLPGCAVNVEYLTATIVHYLSFGEWPPADASGRPYFAYGRLIHNQCERRPHYEYGEFVLAWGDEGAQKGWCLYKMGCKGPETFSECPTVRYANGTSWPIGAGHGCIGCHSPGFWDSMSPFYRRLPPPITLTPQVTVDTYGALLVGGVLAGTAIHGAASYVRQRRGGGHGREPSAAVDVTAPEQVAADEQVTVPEQVAAPGQPAAPAEGEPAALAEGQPVVQAPTAEPELGIGGTPETQPGAEIATASGSEAQPAPPGEREPSPPDAAPDGADDAGAER